MTRILFLSLLLRRAAFDLTGLPPEPGEVEAFLADPDPQAYESAVDRCSPSPRYGEHLARYWLDAARYADTHGIHIDNYRAIWPFRDWVINAFNNNLPFDRFTIEQIAGDLLPGATLDQQVATGFNRCLPTTGEGGAIPRNTPPSTPRTGSIPPPGSGWASPWAAPPATTTSSTPCR
jgi:hypothetical protein